KVRVFAQPDEIPLIIHNVIGKYVLIEAEIECAIFWIRKSQNVPLRKSGRLLRKEPYANGGYIRPKSYALVGQPLVQRGKLRKLVALCANADNFIFICEIEIGPQDMCQVHLLAHQNHWWCVSPWSVVGLE